MMRRRIILLLILLLTFPLPSLAGTVGIRAVRPASDVTRIVGLRYAFYVTEGGAGSFKILFGSTAFHTPDAVTPQEFYPVTFSIFTHWPTYTDTGSACQLG